VATDVVRKSRLRLNSSRRFPSENVSFLTRKSRDEYTPMYNENERKLFRNKPSPSELPEANCLFAETHRTDFHLAINENPYCFFNYVPIRSTGRFRDIVTFTSFLVLVIVPRAYNTVSHGYPANVTNFHPGRRRSVIFITIARTARSWLWRYPTFRFCSFVKSETAVSRICLKNTSSLITTVVQKTVRRFSGRLFGN